jgi:hypothetical protein
MPRRWDAHAFRQCQFVPFFYIIRSDVNLPVVFFRINTLAVSGR